MSAPRGLPDPYPVRPLGGPLVARRVRVPGSKSITNRALVLAALAEGDSLLSGALFSDDTRWMAECLRRLGAGVEEDAEACAIRVRGCAGRFPAREADLFVGNAGTAARFLPPAVAAAGRGVFRFDGDERMRQRPLGGLTGALSGLGADFGPEPGGAPEHYPFTLNARGLEGGAASVDITESSQFASGLLMAAPLMRRGLELAAVGGRAELPYVQMTVALMREFGGHVGQEDHQGLFLVRPGAYEAVDLGIEPDLSAAGYFFAAAAVAGGSVTVLGASRSSLQQDIRLLAVLQHMGCRFYEYQEGEAYGYEQGLTLERDPARPLEGVDIDMNAFSDQALTLAAVAPFCASPVTIRNVAHIRNQECDRLGAIAVNLRAMGVEVDEFADGVRIHPCAAPHGADIKTFRDHRVAMAFAVAGLKVAGVRIEDPGCTAKTFAGFWDALEALDA